MLEIARVTSCTAVQVTRVTSLSKDVYLEKIYLKSLPTLEMWGFFNLEMQIELSCCCDSIKCCIYAYS